MRPTKARVVRSTTDSGALPKTVEIPTISMSGEYMRVRIAKQSSGSAWRPLHAASVSIQTRDGRSTCGPPCTSRRGRSSDSPVRQFRTETVHGSASRAAAKSNRETDTRDALRSGASRRQTELDGCVEIPAAPQRKCGMIILVCLRRRRSARQTCRPAASPPRGRAMRRSGQSRPETIPAAGQLLKARRCPWRAARGRGRWGAAPGDRGRW